LYKTVLSSVLAFASVASHACPPTLDFEFRKLASDESVKLCEQYAGQVLLVVNTASRCAFTPQYEGLEAVYAKYAERGFTVVGFPSNDFGSQEPGAEAAIQKFCRLTYSVDFPMFEKTHVSAQAGAHPFFLTLARESGTGLPKWNFHKYLLDRQGRVVASYPSSTKPLNSDLIGDIERLLN